MDAFKLENFLIDTRRWESSNPPSELLERANELSSTGASVGIGRHPIIGWFGLASGQGPFVWWSEDKELE